MLSRRKQNAPVVHLNFQTSQTASTEFQGASHPSVTGPTSDRVVSIWKGRAGKTVGRYADRLTAIDIAFAQLRQEYARVLRDLSDASDHPALVAAHASLTDVLQALDVQNQALTALRDDMSVPHLRVATVWGARDRDLLAHDAQALSVDLVAVSQDVRRTHVDVAGQLFERVSPT